MQLNRTSAIVAIGVVASGTIVPPSIDEFSLVASACRLNSKDLGVLIMFFLRLDSGHKWRT